MANLRAFAELFKKYSPRRDFFNILQNRVTTLVFTIHFYAKATTRKSHIILGNFFDFWNNYFEVYFTTFIQLQLKVARRSGLLRSNSICLLST